MTTSKVSYDEVDLINDSGALFAYSAIIGLNLLFLLLLMTQSKFVITDSNGITFINPLLPIFRQKRNWNEFDYFILVEENSRYSTSEAVWLIKDGKVKGRFSSFYYSNYQDLKGQIKTRGKGKKSFSPLGQLFVLMGLKKIKDYRDT